MYSFLSLGQIHTNFTVASVWPAIFSWFVEYHPVSLFLGIYDYYDCIKLLINFNLGDPLLSLYQIQRRNTILSRTTTLKMIRERLLVFLINMFSKYDLHAPRQLDTNTTKCHPFPSFLSPGQELISGSISASSSPACSPPTSMHFMFLVPIFIAKVV